MRSPPAALTLALALALAFRYTEVSRRASAEVKEAVAVHASAAGHVTSTRSPPTSSTSRARSNLHPVVARRRAPPVHRRVRRLRHMENQRRQTGALSQVLRGVWRVVRVLHRPGRCTRAQIRSRLRQRLVIPRKTRAACRCRLTPVHAACCCWTTPGKKTRCFQ
jgi:hypothetical protein